MEEKMKTIWIVLISFVATAVIVGGGTYYFINHRATTDKNNLQAQINTLSTNLTATEKSLADAQAAAVATATPAATSLTKPTIPSGWKTYTVGTNSYIDYNFSFAYPSNLFVQNDLGKTANYANQTNWGRVQLETSDTASATTLLSIEFYNSLATLRDTYPDQVNNSAIDTLDKIFTTELYKSDGTETIGGITFNKYYGANDTYDIIYATTYNGHVISIVTDPLLKNQDGTISINNNLISSRQTTDTLDAVNKQILGTFQFTK